MCCCARSPKAGFASREACDGRWVDDFKEGARRGTMGSSAKDTTVFSRVLYQLSYLAKAGQCSRVSL